MTNNWRFDMENAPKDRDIIGYIPSDTQKTVREIWWASDYEGGPGYWSTPPGPVGRGYTIRPEGVTAWQDMPAPPHT